MHVDITEDAFLALIEHHANRVYWKEIVVAVQRHAAEKGFVFDKTGTPAEITVELKTTLAFTAALARNSFLCPDAEKERLTIRTEWDMEDGFARLYLECILAALKAHGITLRPKITDEYAATGGLIDGTR